MSSALFALGRACYRHRRRVFAVWAFVVVLVGALAGLFGTGTTEEYAVPGSESQTTLDDLSRRFPELAGGSGQIVVVAPAGTTVRDAPTRDRISQTVRRLERVPHVEGVTDPFGKDVEGAVSGDGRAAIITAQTSEDSFATPQETKDAIRDEAGRLRSEGIEAVAGGDLFGQGAPAASWVEAIGILVAAIVLLVFFRSVRAAAAPLVSALSAAAATAALIFAATAVVDLTGTAPLLALMICLAVGIDYSLFLLARSRENLADGVEGPEAAARATATAGSAVVFAGLTVVTALLGLVVVGLPFLSAMGVSAAVGVAVAVAASLTLTPALMGSLDIASRRSADRRAARSARAEEARGAGETHADAPGEEAGNESESENGDTESAADAEAGAPAAPAAPAAPRGPAWARAWVRIVTAVPVLTVLVVSGVLLVLAMPAKDLRLALPDNGTQPVGDDARVAYDLITEHFGAGQNGPLLVVADIVSSDDPVGAVDRLRDRVERVPGVARVTLATPNADADTGVVVVVPETGPSDPATADLVHRLRDGADVLGARDDLDLRVTGITAVQIDVSERLGRALLPFGIVVMGLSLLLLLVVFRSFVVPLTATLGFLLSTAAAFGVVTAVFEWGWLADALRITRTGPVISFMPIILMGVLFGLAMDYQMFIMSRMHEHYTRHGDPAAAVRSGFASAAPVVAAAAVIMVAVFAAFVPDGDATIKPIAFGLAVGVALDAFVVRMMLVPAALRLFGHAAWRLPAGLDSRLPHLDVEGHGVERLLAAAPAIEAHPERVVHARGVAAHGPRGPVFADLDLDVDAGELCVLSGPEGSGRTAALLALAGRWPTDEGDLVVAGAVLPEQATAARRRVAIAPIPEVNPLDGDLSIRQHIAERLSTTTFLPWAPRRPVDEIRDRFDEACDVAARATAGGRPEPTFIDDAALVRDLTRLQRAVLGVVLASVGSPPVIVVDDVDDLRTGAEQVGLWAVLGRLAASLPARPAIVATCIDAPDPDDLAAWTGLPGHHIHIERLGTTRATEVTLT